MSEVGARKRYPSKLSIVAVTSEMREEIDTVLSEDKSLSEAEFVRRAIQRELARIKRQKKPASPDA